MKTDPTREGRVETTGIYVRAQRSDGKWVSCDIDCLDTPSLLGWLREHPQRAEQTILLLLGHKVSS